MTRFWRLILVGTALSLLLGCTMYVVTFAGIPYQSPALKMRAQYYHNWALDTGGGYSLVPERDWTLKFGKACCGIQGYLSSTRFVCGGFSVLIPLPFFIVTALGFAFVSAVGMFSRYQFSRDRKDRSDADVT